VVPEGGFFYFLSRSGFGRIPQEGKIVLQFVEVYNRAWEVIALSYRNVSLPTIVPLLGSEDTRLSLMDNGEVIGVFTRWIQEANFMGYVTEAYFPFTGAHVKMNLTWRRNEKNWAFLEGTFDAMRFTSAIDPLEVVECAGATGTCRNVTRKRENMVGALRAGSQWIHIPLRLDDGTELFAGIARVHFDWLVKDSRFYHPNLVVIGKRNDRYRILAVSNCIAMNLSLRTWCLMDTGHRVVTPVAVVIPWSIAYWDFDKDVMDLSLSLQDEDRVVVKVSGIFEAIKKTVMVFDGGDPVPKAKEASMEFGRQYLRKHYNLTS
jgi:hypothetical protein